MLVMRQRNEFAFSGHGGELLSLPTLFGALDTLLGRRNEIPPHMPRRGKWFASQQHHARVAERTQGGFRPWLEHRELTLRHCDLTDGELALRHIYRTLAMIRWYLEGGAARDLRMNIQGRPQCDHRRAQSKALSGYDAQNDAIGYARGQGRRRMMREGRRSVFPPVRQCHPALNAVNMFARCACRRWGSLGMHDAASGRHPIHIARADLAHRAQAIAMFQ